MHKYDIAHIAYVAKATQTYHDYITFSYIKVYICIDERDKIWIKSKRIFTA